MARVLRLTASRHILISGLSVGSGGGYTVAREIFLGLGSRRPDWRITLALIGDFSLHREFEKEKHPSNCGFLWSPPGLRARTKRLRYERGYLMRWASDNSVGCVMTLNGQIVPTSPVPVFAHNQDPWPYRPEAWSGLKDRVIAAVKRREHKRGLLGTALYGWTSEYLRDLVCGWHGVRPSHDQVFYNGIPDSWIDRAAHGAPSFVGRAKQIVTVSNVGRYKRHDVVIRALAKLRKRSGLEDTTYRIIGHGEPTIVHSLKTLAAQLGVGNAVFFEGRAPDDRVQQVLAESRCFCLMSVCESFGIPAIEAMSFGTPVVVSDCCAHPEVCADAAVLCTVDNANVLAEKLANVLLDDAEAERLQHAGLQRVRHFRWSTTVEKMAKAIDGLD
jgi:glycosyltransferase involved in cell wall biosynthesis